MKLLNYNEFATITVIGIDGKNVQVNPKDEVEVSEGEGKGLLENYSHIFRRVESPNRVRELEGKIEELTFALNEKQQENNDLKARNAELEGLLAARAEETGETGEGAEAEETGDAVDTRTPEEIEQEELAAMQELEDAQKDYKLAFGKEAPNNKKNDKEWLVAQVAESKAE